MIDRTARGVMMIRAGLCGAASVLALAGIAAGQSSGSGLADQGALLARPEPAPAREAPRHDLSKEKVLYCVGYAHLDTQWRWDYVTTIDRYIRDTLEQNFALFDAHPGYVFNFTGSTRYEMMREYYPELFERLKKEVAAGRWRVSGSSVDEGDANVPSPESVIRHVLYGNLYFKRTFGKESVDFMLPDCFGFPASMPSIWAHCGLLGFSTQKLTWGSAVGVPFKIGRWIGPDGRSIIAALDPGPYSTALKGRVDTNDEWVKRIETSGERYGVFADYHYYGVGDMGGGPKKEDVENYLGSVDRPDSKIKVRLESSDQMYKDITPEQAARLPAYQGDLLLTEHSAGTLTSQSYMKRWNRMAENAADLAERSAVAAWWLGGLDYPRASLERLWVRLLGNQMHDILPGTSVLKAYTWSWNDLILAMNGFAAITEHATGVVSSVLDTQTQGVPLIVSNALATAREDLVEARVEFAGGVPAHVRVFGPGEVEAPSQELSREGNVVRVLFVARVAPVSQTVFDVRAASSAFADGVEMVAEAGRLESARYVVTIDERGDVSSVKDKAAGGRETLSAPARLVFTHEKPREWPAWNMDWADRQRPPVGFVDGPATVRVVERGPVRATVEVRREARGSIVVQRISVARGDAGAAVRFDCDIDWQSAEVALRASFPLVAASPRATYNWGMGTIERGNNEPVKYEVPSHEWLDLTDASGTFGASILEDSKFGSDKPSDGELRLTLLYTPGVRGGYLDQHSQDWGRHQITYALAPHSGDWRESGTQWKARAINQPLRAFQASRHAGGLGRSFSMASVDTPQVDLRALKLAERCDWVIVRTQELWGRACEARLSLGGAIVEAVEVDGQERQIGPATIEKGTLVVRHTPHSPRSFAVRLASPGVAASRATQTPLTLAFNADVVSRDGARGDGAMDAEGRTLPAEELPASLTHAGITFTMGPSGGGEKNALACAGQTIEIPPGSGALHLLAASSEDIEASVVLGGVLGGAAGGVPIPVQFRSWTGFIGQWDNRVFDTEFAEVDFTCKGRVTGITPGFIHREPVAWFATHRHHPTRGNEAYRFSYLFHHVIEVPQGATRITLPGDARIKVMAITASSGGARVAAAAPLYDDFTGRAPVRFRYEYPPPPEPVFTGTRASGAVSVERAATFEALKVGVPREDDGAAGSRGVVFRAFVDGDKYRPHRRSGMKDGTLPRLNDGDFARSSDDTTRCVWYDTEGRFFADLGAVKSISRVVTYSSHVANRAPQYFSLWGATPSAAGVMPSAAITRENHEGWTLLGVVDSRGLGQGGVHASVVAGDGKPLGPARYLLWIAEDMGEGTFFTEIDVDVAP